MYIVRIIPQNSDVEKHGPFESRDAAIDFMVKTEQTDKRFDPKLESHPFIDFHHSTCADDGCVGLSE